MTFPFSRVLTALLSLSGPGRSRCPGAVRWRLPEPAPAHHRAVRAGGATDVLARMVGAKLTWGQQVVVENRPGAGGNIGAEAGARAAPDGYTLTLAAAGFMAVNPSVYQAAL